MPSKRKKRPTPPTGLAAPILHQIQTFRGIPVYWIPWLILLFIALVF